MKKFISILICVILVVCSFTACNEKEDFSDVENPIATIVVKDFGTITVELYPNIAPNTVKNFISLANSGFYDGVTFHRVIQNFMIQGGDPDGTGNGGPGYKIKGEFSANGFENNLKHERGVISMARASYSYDTAGSQFFLMHGDEGTFLDGQYAAFGKTIEGLDVIDAIANTPCRNPGSQSPSPIEPVVIEKIVIEK